MSDYFILLAQHRQMFWYQGFLFGFIREHLANIWDTTQTLSWSYYCSRRIATVSLGIRHLMRLEIFQILIHLTEHFIFTYVMLKQPYVASFLSRFSWQEVEFIFISRQTSMS